MSKKENSASFASIVGGIIVVYYIFFFDYKRYEFTWVHSIIAFIGMGMLLLGTEKTTEADEE